MLGTQQLLTFVTVVDEGSMTEAANKLRVTQPAISQQIRNLEEQLGAELLMRNSRAIRLTLQGEVLYEQAKQILQLASQAESMIKTLGNQLEGSLRIGTLNALGIQLISPLMSRFLRYNPKVNFRVEFEVEKNLIQKFNEKILDVVILSEISLQHITKENKKQFILKDSLWLVTSGRDPQAPRQIRLRDLSLRPFVWLTGEYPDFENILRSKILDMEIPLSVPFTCSNVGTIKRVIESGLGWGYLPASAVQKQVHSGRLKKIEVSDFSYDVHFYFLTQAHLSSSQSLLADALYQAIESFERKNLS